MFPENFAVLVVGAPNAGMFEFCGYLASTYLGAEERVVFMESNTTIDHVRKQLATFGVNAEAYESAGKLALVDCHSSEGSDRDIDPTAIHVEDLSNLEEIIERVSEGIVRVGGQPVKVLFDSITPLYMNQDSNAVGKFFSALSSMVKVSGKITTTVHHGIVPDDQIALLSTIADGVLEVKVDELFHRFVRIKHFRGLKVAPKWVPFDFEREEESGVAMLSWSKD